MAPYLVTIRHVTREVWAIDAANEEEARARCLAGTRIMSLADAGEIETVAEAGDDDDLCECDGCQNQATHTESWYDEEGVDARVCDEHE